MSRWVFVVLAVVAVGLWGCIGEASPTPGPAPTRTAVDPPPPSCETSLAECWVVLPVLHNTLVALEVEYMELLATAEALPTCGPTCQAGAEPWPTYTPYPTPTSAPDFCRRCIVDQPEPFGCPPGYVCELCAECMWLCVPAESPRAGCNFCGGLVIP